MKLYKNVFMRITSDQTDAHNWKKFLKIISTNCVLGDSSLIKMADFLRVLAKFRLKLSVKQ